MRKLTFGLIATAAAIGFAPAANAVALSYQILDGATVIGSGTNPLGGVIVLAGSDANFSMVTGAATGAPALTSPNFSTNNFTLSVASLANPATLTIRVTETGLSSFAGSIASTFTLNSLTAASTFVSGTIANYFDASNTAYGTATSLGSATFNGIDSFSAQRSAAVNMPGLFSETTIYTLNFKAGGSSSISSSAQLTASPAPEPASWALMLAGFGLMGYSMRSARRKVSFNFG